MGLFGDFAYGVWLEGGGIGKFWVVVYIAFHRQGKSRLDIGGNLGIGV